MPIITGENQITPQEVDALLRSGPITRGDYLNLVNGNNQSIGNGVTGATVDQTTGSPPDGGSTREGGEYSLTSTQNIRSRASGGVAVSDNPNNTSTDPSYGTQTKTYSNALENCASYTLPTRVKTLRTHDKTLFTFFLDRSFTQKFKYRSLVDIALNKTLSFTGGTAGNFWCSATSSADIFYADSTNDGTGRNPVLLPVFFTDTLSSFDLFPSVISFDLNYDDDTKMVDLIAWANYYGYNGPSDYVDTDDETILKQCRKTLIYAKGTYKAIQLLGSTNGSKITTHAFIFSAPVPVYIPRSTNNKNALVTSIPQTHFYEYKA